MLGYSAMVPREVMCAVVGCAAALTTPAHADDEGFPSRPHLVRFHDDVPNRRHTVTDTEGAEIASCVGDCVLRIAPGTYKIYVGQSYRRRLHVTDHDLDVTISPDHPTLQVVGGVTAIAGMVALTAGLLGLFAIGFEGTNDCDAACHERHSRNPLPWEILALGGVAATAGGWVMFGIASPSVVIGHATVAAQPVHGGGLIAFSTRF